jgi:non-specific protein-tyrosine kinase
MNLSSYWKLIRKRLWLILLLPILFVLGALYYLSQQTPTYSTSTLTRVNMGAPNTLLPGVNAGTETLISTYSAFMRTQPFVDRMMEALENHPDLPYSLDPETVRWAIYTSGVRDTQFLRIGASHPNPLVSQILANTAAQVLIRATTPVSEAELGTSQQLDRQRLLELKNLLEEELAYYSDRIAALENEILQLQGGPRSQQVEERISALRTEQFALRGSRVELLSSLSGVETSLNASGELYDVGAETLTVLELAPLPTQAAPVNRIRILFSSLVLALALALLLTWGLEFLNNRIETPEELAKSYGAPVLGAISAAPGKRKGSIEEYLIVLHQPHSPVAESFRALRTAIHLASLDRPIRSLLITSADPGEGKTFVASNLAVSLAQSGYRVILVDGDLRHPQLDQIFGLSQSIGFTNWIASKEAQLPGFLQQTAIDGLRLLTCGLLPSNPAELLNSMRASQIMQQLEDLADIVIYDSPPVAVVSDGLLIAARVDAALQVVRANHTPTSLIKHARSLLLQTNTRLLGSILNRAQAGNLGYYAYHYNHTPYLRNERMGSRNQAADEKILDPIGATGRVEHAQSANGSHDSQRRIEL